MFWQGVVWGVTCMVVFFVLVFTIAIGWIWWVERRELRRQNKP
jgi:membrane protein DedA with SNARE-associated domain